MKKYDANYTGEVIAEWEYEGRQFEARMYEDGFGYICEYGNGYLCTVGDAGYDYFHGNNWKILALKLGVHESKEKGIKISLLLGSTLCDDCEPGSRQDAKWVASGGPRGYLYLCDEHKDEYVEDLFGV